MHCLHFLNHAQKVPAVDLLFSPNLALKHPACSVIKKINACNIGEKKITLTKLKGNESRRSSALVDGYRVHVVSQSSWTIPI